MIISLYSIEYSYRYLLTQAIVSHYRSDLHCGAVGNAVFGGGIRAQIITPARGSAEVIVATGFQQSYRKSRRATDNGRNMPLLRLSALTEGVAEDSTCRLSKKPHRAKNALRNKQINISKNKSSLTERR